MCFRCCHKPLPREYVDLMKHICKTVWQKLDYLRGILGGFSFRHIRYCSSSSFHLIVNDNQKWAYIVHDPGTVVSSEISFESVDYQRVIDKFEKILSPIYFENESLEADPKQRADRNARARNESYHDFIQELKRHG